MWRESRLIDTSNKQLLEDLIEVMTLERLEKDLFRGPSRDIGAPQVFGGQVLGQALMAATATVDAQRHAHSLHAYFLRRGDVNAPIVYEVDRARDGAHFSTRRVVAIQHGAQIFNMSASFQSDETGIDHQNTMPVVPPPDDLPTMESYYRDLKDLAPVVRRMVDLNRPFEFRPILPPSFIKAEPTAPYRSVWFRAVAPVPGGEALHRCLLAYASDFYLLDTAMMPHGVSLVTRKMVVASIDHAMWFHRSVRVDEWMLYSTDSPSASGARGFTRGSIFARDGRLLASTSQEGLLRVI